MTKEEFLELLRKNREEESQMTEDQKIALDEARKRHSRKVRSEILASYAVTERKKKLKE